MRATAKRQPCDRRSRAVCSECPTANLAEIVPARSQRADMSRLGRHDASMESVISGEILPGSKRLGNEGLSLDAKCEPVLSLSSVEPRASLAAVASDAAEADLGFQASFQFLRGIGRSTGGEAATHILHGNLHVPIVPPLAVIERGVTLFEFSPPVLQV